MTGRNFWIYILEKFSYKYIMEYVEDYCNFFLEGEYNLDWKQPNCPLLEMVSKM